jgi:leucyl-tRNA synthetase
MVLKDGNVMSKSKGNVVDPDTMLQKYGADALRLYVMFVAPPEKEVEWADTGLEGSFRFLARVWRMADQWIAEATKASGAIDLAGKTTVQQHHRQELADCIHHSSHNQIIIEISTTILTNSSDAD